MYSFPTLSIFNDLVQPYRDRVYVISDSQYRDMQKEKIEGQIKALKTRADEHRKYLETVEATIVELQNDIAQLPAAKDEASVK